MDRGMMMIGGYGSWAPAMGGRGAVRGTRELYDPYYRRLQRAGPSAWVPVSMLAVILLIKAMPYLRAAKMAYCFCHSGAVRGDSSFPHPLLWIPVAGFIALEFFGASDWYQGVYVGDRYRARPAAYRAAMARGTFPRSGSSSYNYRYNAHQYRGVVSTLMDFGGHLLLILLGIAVFTLVGNSSVPAAPRVPVVPLAPRTLSFPWSWFF